MAMAATEFSDPRGDVMNASDRTSRIALCVVSNHLPRALEGR
jgi:hypothetical protein